MNIKYDNSLYCAEPPEVIMPPLNPKEKMEWQIMEHIDQENYDNGFIDIEAERNRELIIWEEPKN